MKKIILGLVIVLGLSFCVGEIVSASTMYGGIISEWANRNDSNIGSCSDTDGGKDAYKRGIACIGGSCKTDVCTSSTRLREYYCGWGKVGYSYPQTETAEVILRTYTNCKYGCKDGACLRAPTPSYTEGLGTELQGCISNGGIFRDLQGAKGECCAGLHEISSGYKNGVSYCTSEVCGNGACRALENEWNCSEDCAEPTVDPQPISGLQPAINIVKQLIQDLNKLLGLLTNLSN